MNVLLTGSTGFLGRSLAAAMSINHEFYLTAIARRPVDISAAHIIQVTGFDGHTDWSETLSGQRVIIHAAARAHVMKESAVDSMIKYRQVNIEGTLNLARQAADAGVRRFLFISSIGVNGYINSQPFTTGDVPNPSGLYAQSKWEAEKGLWEIQRETGMELVIIRPPLIYGPTAPGNFGKLVRLVSKNLPLPLGAIHNKRSLVALDNLVDLIITCIDHPNAANEMFLVSDDRDVSTTELLNAMILAADKKPMLIPFPIAALRLAGRLTGKLAVIDRLCGNLQVNISHTKNTLGWKPPISFEDGIRKCFKEEL